MKQHNRQDFCQFLMIANQRYRYYSLKEAGKLYGDFNQLPFSLKVLLENQLRFLDHHTTTEADIQAFIAWQHNNGHIDHEINFRPTRVLMQDFTGVPAVVDLAAMRDAMLALGGKPAQINPLSPVDLVIDHSVMVDHYAEPQAFSENVAIEMQRNQERYQFLRWGQQAFDNFRVVPPGTGICHQINLEYLARSVWNTKVNGTDEAFPDTLVGTDSHTTMVNALGVLGWGVGGIEAEAAMLGQPVSMLIPEVIGFKLTGKLQEGITATDLVLTITQMLRAKGVVGKFVEFYGDGLSELSLPDRATISNMAPEYGATCGFFPIDEETLHYLRLTNQSEAHIELVRSYAQAQGLWRNPGQTPLYTDQLFLDMAEVEASLAGPKRPQDRVALAQLPSFFDDFLAQNQRSAEVNNSYDFASNTVAVKPAKSIESTIQVDHEQSALRDGAVVIAAITSCTNTSNASVMMAAGLLAQKAVARGLQRKPWVKTSLAPGSRVVSDYLVAAGLQDDLDRLGFNLVGYGCTTCIGNSGPLSATIEQAINQQGITVAAVLSGNRNFEGRIHPLVQTNWLASPPLVVAYALAGNMQFDLTREPLGIDQQGQAVYLRDIWPTQQEINTAVAKVTTAMFDQEYAAVFDGDAQWQAIAVEASETYHWHTDSSYIQHPPYFYNIPIKPAPLKDIVDGRVLLMLGDSVTTDHISPAGAIKKDSPAGRYLQAMGILPQDFNSYGARRGNHEVMMRGTFANVRIRNEMLNNIVGGYTRITDIENAEPISVYDAAMHYAKNNTPLIIIAGKEYGTGSSRDWAAKGTLLLGVRAVLVESFERIHRSNLIGMGVLPLQFQAGQNRQTFHLTGDEQLSISNLQNLTPKAEINITVTRPDGSSFLINALCRIDTEQERQYYQHGGILHYVLRQIIHHQ